MGNVAQSLGQPVLFPYEGKDYSVSPWTLEIQSHFERYLEREILEGFHRTKHALDPDQADKVAATLTSDIGLGKYTFGTEAVGNALRSKKHLLYLFFLCVKRNHKEVQLEEVGLWARSKETWDRMVEVMNLANFDPKPKTPGEEMKTPPALSPES